MLATTRATPFASPGPDIRPLRAIDPARARAAGPQARAAPDGLSAEPRRRAELPASGYGRPAARLAPGVFGASAFLAQMIAQADDASPGAPRVSHDEGVRAYRRMTGDDLVVVGPAGAAGLVL